MDSGSGTFRSSRELGLRGRVGDVGDGLGRMTEGW